MGACDTVRPDGVPVKALTEEMLQDIVASYGKTAALAKRAGFQMIMIHGGHGWLINQFLSLTLTNVQTNTVEAWKTAVVSLLKF